MRLFKGLVSNHVELSTRSYSAILGTSPSKGARSPLLWNATYRALGVDCAMLPLDISAESLPTLIKVLRSDKRYVGGACAMPHKALLVSLLDDVESEAKTIGAVNCIHRTSDGLLRGANTDGLGFLSTLARSEGLRHDSRVVILGAGAAGRAVAVYLSRITSKLCVVNRTRRRAEDLANVCRDAFPLYYPIATSVLNSCSLLVNCTSLGQKILAPTDSLAMNTSVLTALSPSEDPAANKAESSLLINTLPRNCLVYDIVYQPSETALLKLAKERGLRTINGLQMNLEQAVIAFTRTHGETLPVDAVRDEMRKVS